MLRLSLAAYACLALMANVAIACPGQQGKVIFEDTFADDSGGWVGVTAPDIIIKDGAMSMHPNARGMQETSLSVSSLNGTFPAGDGDYCVEFILPKSVAPDNDVGVSLIFHAQDTKNYLKWGVWTNGAVDLKKLAANKWIDLFSTVTPPVPVKTGPDAVNSLRVVAKGDKITLYLNGSQVKTVRAALPAGELRFGLIAAVDKASDQNPVVTVKSFKVTEGE